MPNIETETMPNPMTTRSPDEEEYVAAVRALMHGDPSNEQRELLQLMVRMDRGPAATPDSRIFAQAIEDCLAGNRIDRNGARELQRWLDEDAENYRRRVKSAMATLGKLIVLDDRAKNSTHAILQIHSGIEIGHGAEGAEVTCTVRPRDPFRPERLAIHAVCADSFDLIDLKVALCSVFAGDATWPDAGVPAARYATAYEFQPQIADHDSDLHRAILINENLIGLPIASRVCPPWHDISVTVRHRPGMPPANLEIVIYGTAMSEEDGYQIYLREREELLRTWRIRH